MQSNIWIVAGLGILMQPLTVMGQSGTATATRISAQESGTKLVEAIIVVESQGNANRVGSHGERGLMQIRLTTWREVTQKMFGAPQPFQHAFDGALNRRVGHAYLAQLQAQLRQHRADWQADERTLLIAAYNAGPTLLAQKNFDLHKLPASTRDYVERVSNIHDALLAELLRTEQQRQLFPQNIQQVSPRHVASL